MILILGTALLRQDTCIPGRMCIKGRTQSLHEFTLTEFSKRKQFNHQYMSSSFYTHQVGYKFSIRVYANGWGSSTGLCVCFCVTCYLDISWRGDYDDQLEWPYRWEF